MFIGVKMTLHDWVHVPNGVSLGVVLGILAAAVVISLLRPGKPQVVAGAEVSPGDFEHSPAAQALAAEEARESAEDEAAPRG
jgi:hypothetical protein